MNCLELNFFVFSFFFFCFRKREANEHRNAASDPFTRRRCAPTLVTKVDNNKTDE